MKSSDVYAASAKQLFEQGYNCSQSVAGAFYEDIGLSLEQTVRMVSGYGGGMGRMREVCGCVSGMVFVLGCLYGYEDPKAYTGKAELYGHVQQVADSFCNENGSIICRELLGMEGNDTSHIPSRRTDAYYKKRPCAELAACAAHILADYIAQLSYT